MVMAAQTVRKNGSLVDSITLEEFPFQYEPVVKDKETTGFAKQAILGHRLPRLLWVGNGSSQVSLDVFLLGGAIYNDVKHRVQLLKNLSKPQADIGAPHPVYINVGGIYTGRKFVLVDVQTAYTRFELGEGRAPDEATVKLVLEELPANKRYTGTGARK
jgi:hypothetical protein